MMNYINYMHYGYGGYGFGGGFVPYLLPLVVVLSLWAIFWKGLALWNAAKHHEKAWFIALLVINTFGILEIIYLFLIKKIKWSDLW
ncbi:MAG: DUF5652 family protein [Patescibacteria group bacterium]